MSLTGAPRSGDAGGTTIGVGEGVGVGVGEGTCAWTSLFIPRYSGFVYAVHNRKNKITVIPNEQNSALRSFVGFTV